jgi:hypothetical protein
MNDAGTNWQSLGSTLALTTGGVATGIKLPACGSGKPLNSSNALALLKPEESDARMIAALQRLSGHSIAFATQLHMPNDGPSYRVITGVSWSCPASKRDEAMSIVEHSLRAAPDEKIVAALYRLRTLTRGKIERSSADQEGEMLIWAEQLRCWPGDVALDVIRNWPSRENGQWWPTWHEVEVVMKQRCEKRIAIANVLRRSEPGLMIESKVDPLGAGATAEERERAVARWERDMRPAMQPAPVGPRMPERGLEEMLADPLPPLGEYARMTKAERAARILGERGGF